MGHTIRLRFVALVSIDRLGAGESFWCPRPPHRERAVARRLQRNAFTVIEHGGCSDYSARNHTVGETDERRPGRPPSTAQDFDRPFNAAPDQQLHDTPVQPMIGKLVIALSR